MDGFDRDGVLRDKRTQQAVVMSLVVIGEMSAKLMDRYPDFAAAVPRSNGGTCAA